LPARVLVVDDDSLAGELICEILRSAGMDASFLTSSTEAAGLLKQEKYHAVFLDMRMPPPDGVELARQIRASRVNASTVIVMITGEEERTLMKRAFEAGATRRGVTSMAGNAVDTVEQQRAPAVAGQRPPDDTQNRVVPIGALYHNIVVISLIARQPHHLHDLAIVLTFPDQQEGDSGWIVEATSHKPCGDDGHFLTVEPRPEANEVLMPSAGLDTVPIMAAGFGR
jgi:CheY-like chemotaxis protein